MNKDNKQYMAQAIESKQVYGTLLSECQDIDFLRSAAEKLWSLLDDIDTAGDMFKPHDMASYKSYDQFISKCHGKRFRILESDGYDLFLPIEATDLDDG